MKIELWRYRISTPIKDMNKAVDIALSLSGGDNGLLYVTCGSRKAINRIMRKHITENYGEWRFVVVKGNTTHELNYFGKWIRA